MASILEKTYNLFRSIEDDLAKGQTINESKLDELKNYLSSFKNHKDVNYFKLASIPYHLHSNLNLKEWTHWLVPIERLLAKNLKDEDFLIRNIDKTPTTLNKNLRPISIVLDNLRSSFNVGSIFRSAEAFSCSHIYLCGYSPDPENLKTKKTTLGSEKYISWSHHPSTIELLKQLKTKQNFLVAAETTSHAETVRRFFNFDKHIILVFGNERFGLDSQIISLCDDVRQVSLTGFKNSLNVANCASIFLYELSEQYTSFINAKTTLYEKNNSNI